MYFEWDIIVTIVFIVTIANIVTIVNIVTIETISINKKNRAALRAALIYYRVPHLLGFFPKKTSNVPPFTMSL